MTILPLNPVTGNGCKTCKLFWNCDPQDLARNTCDTTPICVNTTGETYIQCVQQEAYSTNDIIPKIMLNLTSVLMNYEFIRAKEFFASDEIGFILQSLEIANGIMIHNDTFPIGLNENLSYIIVFTDPKLQLYTASSVPFPRHLMTLKPHVGLVDFRLQVKHYKSIHILSRQTNNDIRR